MQKDKDLVSVIIPVYNRADQIREAVMSVLLQSYSNIEIHIIDDGSNDETFQVVELLKRKWRDSIIVYSQVNSGPGPARELGTRHAQGAFIQYLDSDDILLETKFELQVAKMKQETKCGICYGISYEEDFKYHPPLLRGPLRATGEEISTLFPRLLNERWWTTSTPLYKRELVRMMGPWANLVNEEDWDFDARAGKLRTSLAWVNHAVSIRRINIGNHLSEGGMHDKQKLRDRIEAKQRLFRNARVAGMRDNQLEMKLFSKECFFLARQSGEIGLTKSSTEIFALARNCAGKYGKHRPEFLVYGLMILLLGPIKASRVSTRLRSMLK